MGWLGWSEDELMDADISSILVGYRGKMKMLKSIFGSSDDDVETPNSKSPPSVKDFKSFAATHNAIVGKRKKT